MRNQQLGAGILTVLTVWNLNKRRRTAAVPGTMLYYCCNVIIFMFFIGCITLVATGPLTNIATALMLDPHLGTKLKDCVIMGGNYLGELMITRSEILQ